MAMEPFDEPIDLRDISAEHITLGPGLMVAACIEHYFKRLAKHDLINFSEKFGTPGIVVHTTAAKDSPEGLAAMEMARGLAGNYRGVQFNAPENKVEIVWPEGGTAGSNLPMVTIIEDGKRELTSLWLGEDLSTMSRSVIVAFSNALVKAGSDDRHFTLTTAQGDIPAGILLNDQVDSGEANAIPKNIALLGIWPETLPAVAAGAIAAYTYVVADLATPGRVKQLPAAAGTYVVIGRSRFAVVNAGDPVSIMHCVPHNVVVP